MRNLFPTLAAGLGPPVFKLGVVVGVHSWSFPWALPSAVRETRRAQLWGGAWEPKQAPGGLLKASVSTRGGMFPQFNLHLPAPLSSASISAECSNPIYGQTLNPLRLKKSPGGSSGGEGVLFAQGGSILGMGTDTGGSIRIPASFCGVCGLRTTGYRLRYLVLV